MAGDRLSYGAAFALGAAATYLLDPRRGRRRRHELEQKAEHVFKEATGAAEVAGRDLANRSRGFVHRLSQWTGSKPAPDDVLVARVRSHVGRMTSHPHALGIAAKDGVVELSGQVLASELKDVLQAASRTSGVYQVIDRLEPHLTADSPSLQGGVPRRPPVALWSPSMRMGAALLGSGAVSFGLWKRGWLGGAFATGGGMLLTRSIVNAPVRQVLGLSGGVPMHVSKSLHIHAPVEDVYAYFRAFENFPRFMRHVRDVRLQEHGRSEWIIDGPFGIPVRSMAQITEETPNEKLAWKTLVGSDVRGYCVARFEPDAQGGTLLSLRFEYRPLFGIFSELAGWLSRATPKHAIDDDLLRLKSLLERGKASGRVGPVTLDELPIPPPPGPVTIQ